MHFIYIYYIYTHNNISNLSSFPKSINVMLYITIPTKRGLNF